MIHIDILDEGFDLETSLDLLLRHVLSDLSWISLDSSNETMSELFVLLSLEIISQDDGFLSSIFSSIENYDLSLFVDEFSGVGHRFIKILFLTIFKEI